MASDRNPDKPLTRQHWGIFWLAVIGLGGTAFAQGSNLGIALDEGHGWWKVGIGAFVYLCLCFALWGLLRRLAMTNNS
jgi:hypothetical protein